MHSAGNKSQVCKMERLHCFVFAQDYHCSCHLHSPPIIIIVAAIIIVVTIAIIVIVINVINIIIVAAIVVIISVVISLDSSQVALVAPGVCATVWSNQVSVPNILLCSSLHHNFSLLKCVRLKF